MLVNLGQDAWVDPARVVAVSVNHLDRVEVVTDTDVVLELDEGDNLDVHEAAAIINGALSTQTRQVWPCPDCKGTHMPGEPCTPTWTPAAPRESIVYMDKTMRYVDCSAVASAAVAIRAFLDGRPTGSTTTLAGCADMLAELAGAEAMQEAEDEDEARG